jgi:hypothetical protein
MNGFDFSVRGRALAGEFSPAGAFAFGRGLRKEV